MGPMERYVRFVVRHRVAVLGLVLVGTALMALQLRHLRLEIRRRAALPQHHPYVQIQNRITDLFGGEAVVIIGVIANQGDVFAPEVLRKIHRITGQLQDTPGVIVPSLFSLAAPYVKTVTAGPDGTMEVRPLMEVPPEDPAAIEALRAAVHDDPLLNEALVSADGTATVIVAEFDDRLTDMEIGEYIERIVGPERDARVAIALAGAPILRVWLTRYTQMIAILFPLAVGVIGLIHYEAFRTLQAMVLPLATALLSVVWALGIMGATGEPMDTWSAITPVVILAVAAGHAVQILKRYYEEYGISGNNQDAVVRSLVAVGPVMLTAGLIAAAGFGSLATFGIASVRVFGLLLASGILSALVLEMTFTPACRSLLPPPRGRELRRERETPWLDRGLDRLAALVVARPRSVLVAAGVVVLLAGVGVARLDVDNSFRLWFAPSTQVRKDDRLLNAKLPGTASLRILVEGTRPNAVLEPEVLRAMSDLEAVLESDARVRAVVSIADQVKRMHRAMQGGDRAAYVIPDNPRLVAQYALLYSMAAGPDGLSAFIDAAAQRAVIRGLSKTDSAAFSRQIISRLEVYARERFRGLPVEVGIAGGTLGVQTAMNDLVIREKIENVFQVSAIIFLLSAVVLRSVVGGVFVLLPLAAAVCVSLGVMGWTRTWLDMTTAAITAMGVSIGADFAIYLIFRMREERTRRRSLRAAIRVSLQTSGKAVFFVSSAVALGYLVLACSGFSIWMRLGALTATMIGVSALATITIIPCLALIVRPRFLAAGPVGHAASPAPSATDARPAPVAATVGTASDRH